MRNWLIVVLLLVGISVLAKVHAQQQSQQQGPDETSMTLLGQCVYNNNANSIRAVTVQRQLMAMQEQEKATTEYWAAYVQGIAAMALKVGPVSGNTTIEKHVPSGSHLDKDGHIVPDEEKK
jgi:hypothetical protein